MAGPYDYKENLADLGNKAYDLSEKGLDMDEISEEQAMCVQAFNMAWLPRAMATIDYCARKDLGPLEEEGE